MSIALEKQRTYALLGTGGSGKTSLAEMLLFQAGIINRLGAVEEGTTALDYEPEEIIFEDEGTLLQYRYHEKKQTLYEGKAVLTPTEFRFGKRVIRVSSITSASPFSGGKLIFSDGEKDYIFVGHERFNPVKYVMMFHRLSPSFDKNDHYFSLTDSEK